PVLCKVGLHHVDVVGADSAGRVALYEPGIEGWTVVSMRRAPEVLVALRLQQGSDPIPGRLEVGDLHEQVHDGLRRESWHGAAAKVLYPPDQFRRQARQQMLLFTLKQ